MKAFIMSRKFFLTLFTLLILFSQQNQVFAELAAVPFSEDAKWRTCFTPTIKGKQRCTDMLVDIIDDASESIYMQAYSFTSQPIADALERAAERDVKVNVIFDRGQGQSQYSQRLPLAKNTKVNVYVDKPTKLAHNKVVIVDAQITVTGSFNYSKSAQNGNTENLLAIQDKDLAKNYYRNWLRRYMRVTRQKATRNGGYTVPTPNGKKAASKIAEIKSPDFSRKRRAMEALEEKEDETTNPKGKENAKRLDTRSSEKRNEQYKPTESGATKRAQVTSSPLTPTSANTESAPKRTPFSPVPFRFDELLSSKNDETSMTAAQAALQAALEAQQ